jgi:hypothetical protein
VSEWSNGFRRLGATAVAVGAVAVLPGCAAFRENCHAPQDYQAARSNPPIQVPEGLAAPPTRGALRIPDLPEDASARERGPGDPCLAEPPSFFPGRPRPGAEPPARPAEAAKPAAEAPRAPPPPTFNDDPPKP